MNLLVRLLIGIVAVLFIAYKLKEDFLLHIQYFKSNTIDYKLVLVVFLMVFLNWGVEAFKWKLLVQKIQRISFITSFKVILTALTIGIITPNRIGEIPARAILLNNRDKFKDVAIITVVGGYSQMLITLITGAISSLVVLKFFGDTAYSSFLPIILIAFSFLFLSIYFFPKKLKSMGYKIPFVKKKKILEVLDLYSFKELVAVLMLSGFRYFIFFTQYYLILKAFHIEFLSFSEVLLISFYFMITSFIPTILISEIGVRGSVALFIFMVVSDQSIAIISSSVVLWVINIGAPALFGTFYLKQFKIYKAS